MPSRNKVPEYITTIAVFNGEFDHALELLFIIFKYLLGQQEDTQ